MRISGVSKLDPFGDEICNLWKKGDTPAEIRRTLQKKNCQVTHTTLSTWIDRQIESGKLHPRKQRSQHSEAHSTITGTLGLLSHEGDEDRQQRLGCVLRVLLEPGHNWTLEEVRRTFEPGGFELPLSREGEPDFTRLALTLGERKFQKLGDMDFVLLSSWTREFRELQKAPLEEFGWRRRASRLIRLACEIRDEMSSALWQKTASL